MRDTMILIARMMSDTRIERLNQEMIKFGKNRGLWCKDGIMMNPSKENLEHMLDLMKKKISRYCLQNQGRNCETEWIWKCWTNR